MSSTVGRIGIVGSGSVGTYYGARMVGAGAEVRFLMRSDLETVRRRGSLRIHDAAGMTEVAPVAVFGSPAEIGPVDLVVLTVKTTSSAAVRELVSPLLGAKTAIFTLQNGLGVDEYLAGLFGAERIMGALVFMAITRIAPGEVRCFHPGMVSVGEFRGPAVERTRALVDLLAASGMKAFAVDNLLEARWRKLVWNIPFNGLSIAEGGVTTDRICSEPRLAAEARALMVEVQSAAGALGFAIPDAFLDKQFEVTPPMGPYRPSSLVDFMAGRDVEVEPIWGEPLRRAGAAGVAMPHLERLYGRLRALCPGSPAP
ncbi:MAG TPA: 2-dehydropantoate 2-reductase [Opitutaceae bacterium]|jgi:2-dehydropantoate 2-reductase